MRLTRAQIIVWVVAAVLAPVQLLYENWARPDVMSAFAAVPASGPILRQIALAWLAAIALLPLGCWLANRFVRPKHPRMGTLFWIGWSVLVYVGLVLPYSIALMIAPLMPR